MFLELINKELVNLLLKLKQKRNLSHIKEKELSTKENISEERQVKLVLNNIYRLITI